MRKALGRGFILRAGVVEFGELPAQALDFALHLAEFVEDGEALFENGAAREAQAFLRQVADAHAARLLHAAVVERLEAGQHLHQRGFAGAVGADQRGSFLVSDQPVGLKKQDARTEALAGILQREHCISIFAESEKIPASGAKIGGK